MPYTTSPIARRIRRYAPRDVGVPAVVIHELYYGAFKSQRVEKNMARAAPPNVMCGYSTGLSPVSFVPSKNVRLSASGLNHQQRRSLSTASRIISTLIGHDSNGHSQFDTTRGELVYRLKNRSDQKALAPIARAAVEFIKGWAPQVDAIVPVPPSRKRAYQPVGGDRNGDRKVAVCSR